MKKILLIVLMPLLAFPMTAGAGEPDIQTARLWWPEQYNVWTPVCWPDHYHKFSVLYNGSVVISPGQPASRKPHAKQWLGEDFQLTFCSSEDGHIWPLPAGMALLRDWDGGLGIQSWDREHDTPVITTEFRNKDGVVLETRMFAHIKGASDVETGIEPEYLWIRTSVKSVDSYYHPNEYKMSVLLTKLFFGHVDFVKLSPDISVVPECTHCDRALHMEDGEICEDNGKVRLRVLPSENVSVDFNESASMQYNLTLTFPSEPGASIDMIFPALVDDRDDMAAEASVSFEKALEESDKYWASLKPETAATFEVPEPFINEAILQNFKIARSLGEKDWVTKDYSYISGVWQYDAYWPTPGSMVSAMFMDPMGYFADTERYSEVFAHHQGKLAAPGSAFKLHPGYFSTPRYLESVDWLTDHGAVMYQIATHGLLTGDRDFIEKWNGPLEKACDFIMEYSRSEHDGVAGLLPAGWSTDEEVPLQSVWSLAWNYKGLSEAVRLFKKTGNPRAEEFDSFRKEFKETFQKEYRKVVESGPKWTDDRGNVRFRPPTEFSVEAGSRFQTDGRPVGHTFMTDAFYLDSGPLCLVWAGLLDAEDPIMVDMLDFFREGPNWKLHKPFPWSLDRAVLEHEISSCEPCYSFNAYHSWQLNDRQHFLEAMYSVLVGAVSNNTFISCEHRHGIQGTQFAFPFGFYLARLAVIDDRIEDNEIHLLRMCPLAWLKNDVPSRFLRMPTEYGTINLVVKLSEDEKCLEVTFDGEWREKPGKIVLHVPPVPGLKSVSINGKRHPVKNRECIVL